MDSNCKQRIKVFKFEPGLEPLLVAVAAAPAANLKLPGCGEREFERDRGAALAPCTGVMVPLVMAAGEGDR